MYCKLHKNNEVLLSMKIFTLLPTDQAKFAESAIFTLRGGI